MTAPFDILRCAYAELVVTDLAASRAFYVDVLGLTVSYEDDDVICLRTLEEFIHHNLVLRRGPVAAAAALAFRVRTPDDVDRAQAYYESIGVGPWHDYPAHGLNTDAFAGAVPHEDDGGHPAAPARFRTAGTTFAGVEAALGIYAGLARQRAGLCSTLGQA